MTAYRFPALQWTSTGGTTRPASKIAIRDLDSRLSSPFACDTRAARAPALAL